MGLAEQLAAQRIRGFQTIHGPSAPPKHRESGDATSEQAGIGPVTRKNVAQVARMSRKNSRRT